MAILISCSHSVTLFEATLEELLFSQVLLSEKDELEEGYLPTDLRRSLGRYVDGFLVFGTDKKKRCGHTTLFGERLSGQDYRRNHGRASGPKK